MCFTQKTKECRLNKFIKEKDSILYNFLLSKIDTGYYSCAYQESTDIYIFTSNKKCYICSKEKIDSITDESFYTIPYILSEGKNRMNDLLKERDTSYSTFGAFYYFEKVGSENLSFYTSFSTLMKDKFYNKFANDLFSFFGLARFRLGMIPK
jgi:hypothetical protein